MKKTFLILCASAFLVLSSGLIYADENDGDDLESANIDKILVAGRGCCSHHHGQSGKCQDGRVVCNDGTISPTCRCQSSNSETTCIN